MTVVVDASVVAAALIDPTLFGWWAVRLLRSEALCAPHLMPVEVANTLRRAESRGAVDAGYAFGAHDDLLQFPIELYPYEPLALRAWELRASLTTYDAWYVALAEALDVPLATLDRRLATTPGPRCGFVLPPA